MINSSHLSLDRCPHCGIAKPNMSNFHNRQTSAGCWWFYECSSCAQLVMTRARVHNGEISKIWPEVFSVSESVPQRARDFLSQAASSFHAPAGAVMLTASAVDAMLKFKNYKNGTLNNRIDEAAKAHLITLEMAEWAHEVRLDANDQRHADEAAPLPSKADAEKSLDFAMALAQFLYVLPASVAEGRKTKVEPNKKPGIA